MSQDATFEPATLAREIALRGLTPEEFAEEAGINRNTIYRALQGKRLKPGTMGKINRTLARLPVIVVADGLLRIA